MSALTTLPSRPVCLSCLRRSLLSDTTPAAPPSYNQVRGKKKFIRKRNTINVRLLKDVKGYGPRGSIVPVSPGMFRNKWLPHRRAEYLSTLPGAGVNGSKINAMRDALFGRVEDEEEDVHFDGTQRPTQASLLPPKPSLSTITPELATAFLDDLLPPHIPFYRAAIISTPPTHPQSTSSSSGAVTPATAALDAATPMSDQRSKQLFGSVTAADIADAVRLHLADTDAKNLAIGTENITILPSAEEGGGGIEGDKLKALGEFPVEIRVKGGEPVMRIVSVRKKEEGMESRLVEPA